MQVQHVVLVRAFEGQPLRRILVEESPDILYVANPRYLGEVQDGHSRPIGFYRRDCFAWDEDAFERLAKSYAAEKRTRPEAWSGMPPFDGRTPARTL